ncbi:MAG: undecaprenyl/decaprenyl-phosphate alpha-N-acetylglucosaminyl 1-phosphate transferase [Candidatus Buchananbacteria bacterium]|nr:undecaprenyl/decaprenyl-phosphate alpha-N-acetylglucosaminyl 1-phosphate transferase [Candidatus Buchananbacteria bacterium]
MFYIFPFLVSFFLAIFFTPLIKRLALKFRIVDSPGLRKIHQKPIPLLGGLAIFLAFFISVLFFWFNGSIIDSRVNSFYIIGILLGSLILMIGGFLDDKYNLKPWQQISFPVSAIIITLIAGIRIHFVSNPFGGILEFGVIIGFILAFFWLLIMTYTTKLLDGLDGLASGVTTIAAFLIFIVSLFWDVPFSSTSVLALIVAGATLGFLIFNWHPAKIFLGEGGSVFCGYILGVLAIISGSKIATALLVMGIPVLDVVWVVIRRLFFDRSITKGDQKHLHFRLLEIGLSHRQAVIFLYLLTLAFGFSSLFLASFGKIIALLILLIFMVILFTSLYTIYRLKNSD